MKNKRIVIACAASILIIAAALIVYAATSSSGKSLNSSKPFKLVQIDPNAYYKVTSVIDGDTFQADVNGKIITVRVLGINTPETVDPKKPVECYGPEASAEAKELLTGRKVRLVANPNREALDIYHRYLLYVYRDDGLFYNDFMVKNGFAHEYTFNNEAYEFQSQFRNDQAEAKAANIGMWKKCGSAG